VGHTICDCYNGMTWLWLVFLCSDNDDVVAVVVLWMPNRKNKGTSSYTNY
jgi:hypothetical protein